MSKDILSETFQKHLKLLHKHLNINEAGFYAPSQDPRDWKRIPNSPSRWDDVATTGGEMRSDGDGYKTDPRDKLGPYVSPEEEARNKFKNTVAGYARYSLSTDEDNFVRYLNQIKYQGKNNWEKTDNFKPYDHTDNSEFDTGAYKRWTELEKTYSDISDINQKERNEVEKLKKPVSSLIQTLGTIGWQKYKRLDNKRKIARLLLLALIPDNKQKLKAELGSNYDELLNRLKNADYKKDVQDVKILTLAIEKAEKMLGRGFFEQ